jgi:hypothetical protein
MPSTGTLELPFSVPLNEPGTLLAMITPTAPAATAFAALVANRIPPPRRMNAMFPATVGGKSAGFPPRPQ